MCIQDLRERIIEIRDHVDLFHLLELYNKYTDINDQIWLIYDYAVDNYYIDEFLWDNFKLHFENVDDSNYQKGCAFFTYDYINNRFDFFSLDKFDEFTSGKRIADYMLKSIAELPREENIIDWCLDKMFPHISERYKKVEAFNRMQKLNIFDEVIARFIYDNQVCIFAGAYYRLNSEQKLRIKEFEAKNDVLIYYVIVDNTPDGITENYLFVNQNSSECYKESPYDNPTKTIAWIYNDDKPELSKVGMVDLRDFEKNWKVGQIN